MVYLIAGPMYSGKSQELYKQMARYIYARQKVLLIRPQIDNRGYFSHSNADISKIKTIAIKNFDVSLLLELDSYDAIFVDEFFMIKDSYKLASLGIEKDIFFSGLLATSECKVFDEVVKVLPYCDYILKLNAVCVDCGSQLGNYSYFKGTKSSDIVVGDSDYIPLCQKCYTNKYENE